MHWEEKSNPIRTQGWALNYLLLIRKVFESCHGQVLWISQFSTWIWSRSRISVIWKENENKPESCINTWHLYKLSTVYFFFLRASPKIIMLISPSLGMYLISTLSCSLSHISFLLCCWVGDGGWKCETSLFFFFCQFMWVFSHLFFFFNVLFEHIRFLEFITVWYSVLPSVAPQSKSNCMSSSRPESGLVSYILIHQRNISISLVFCLTVAWVFLNSICNRAEIVWDCGDLDALDLILDSDEKLDVVDLYIGCTLQFLYLFWLEGIL